MGKYTINSKLLVITRGSRGYSLRISAIFFPGSPHEATSEISNAVIRRDIPEEHVGHFLPLPTSKTCVKMCGNGKLMVYHIIYIIYIWAHCHLHLSMNELNYISICILYERVWINIIYIYIIIIILIIITELGQSNSDSSMIAGQTHLCQSFPRTPFFSGLGLSLP